MYKRRRKTILKIDLLDKSTKNIDYSLKVNGYKDEIFFAVVNIVFALIEQEHLSIDEMVLAFKEGIKLIEELEN